MDRNASTVPKWLFVERADLSDVRSRLAAIERVAGRSDLPVESQQSAIRVLAVASIRVVDDAVAVAAA